MDVALLNWQSISAERKIEALAHNYCKIKFADLSEEEFAVRLEAVQFDISKILQIITLVLSLIADHDLTREEISGLIQTFVQIIWGDNSPEFVQLIMQLLPIILPFFLEVRDV